MSRYVVLGALLLVVLALCAPVHAASTQDVTLTVTIRQLGVSAAPTSYGFGTVDVGTSPISTTPIVVTNTGNDDEDIGIKIKTEDSHGEWTPAGTAAANVYVLSSRLAVAAGSFVAGDILTTSVQWCDGTKFGGGGRNMASLATVNQWFQFAAPTSVSGANATAEHTITIELSCQEAAP